MTRAERIEEVGKEVAAAAAEPPRPPTDDGGPSWEDVEAARRLFAMRAREVTEVEVDEQLGVIVQDHGGRWMCCVPPNRPDEAGQIGLLDLVNNDPGGRVRKGARIYQGPAAIEWLRRWVADHPERAGLWEERRRRVVELMNDPGNSPGVTLKEELGKRPPYTGPGMRPRGGS